MSVYDFVMKDAEGVDVSLADYKGKVLLIVNTATGCGFTPQYNALEELYEKYKDRGFEILDFPCNQ
ncbi:MAG: redoxin domain-containing protein, partial [Firmicutes bacterium]|nr:redoxin domain-containing protein [Bacillota bacterium]